MSNGREQAQRAVDAQFAMYGKDAVYAAPGGQTTPCRVYLDQRDRGLAGMRSRPALQSNVLEVRAVEISNPSKNGAFSITETGEVLTVLDDPQHEDDPERLVWTMTVR